MAISEQQLAEWEQLANEATEWPWEYGDDAGDCYHKRYEIYDGEMCLICPEIVSKNDAAFIAAARTAVPALIAEVRGLQKTLHAVSDTSNKLLEDNNQLCSQNGQLQSEHLEMSLEVGRLKMKVTQLEKEADWLAWKITDVGGCRYCCSDCGIMTDPVKCFREDAKKAVESE